MPPYFLCQKLFAGRTRFGFSLHPHPGAGPPPAIPIQFVSLARRAGKGTRDGDRTVFTLVL